MTLEEFKRSLSAGNPPENCGKLLQAMWHDAAGDWNKAHQIAQEIENSSGSLVHAYLHRKEGDKSNARYWYSAAGRTFPEIRLEDEWDQIVEALLKRE